MWILMILILLIAGIKLFGKLLPYLIGAVIIVYFIEYWWLVLLVAIAGYFI
ncbi:hypothetical protein Q757_10135, partial [Oenococcus alcoholitolerans]